MTWTATPSDFRSPPTLASGNRRAPGGAGWLLPIRRLQRMAVVLGRHGFGELASGLLRFSGLTPAGAPAASAPGARLGRRVARVLADLGPSFVKLGQLLATREDLLPPEIVRELAALHADVPPLAPRIVIRAVQSALGRPISVVFPWFDPRPLAAASVGQVHRARLRSGEMVVVKVQRPGLPQVVEADLALMRALAALLSQVSPELGALDPPALVAGFERSIRAELDFCREATNARRLAEALAGAHEVRVPRVYDEWTRPTLVVQEHVVGRRIGELDPVSARRARQLLLRAFVQQIFEHGLFHADPHPGNLLYDEAGRLVLLDLGAVEALEPPLRRSLSRLARAFARGRADRLGEAVLALSPPQGAVDRPRLERDLAGLVAAADGPAPGARVLGDMVAIGRVHRLRMPATLVALVRALALLDGVLRRLDPDRDLRADLRRELVWAGWRRLLGLGRRLTRSPGRFVRWLGAWGARLWSLVWRFSRSRC